MKAVPVSAPHQQAGSLQADQLGESAQKISGDDEESEKFDFESHGQSPFAMVRISKVKRAT
ncbi:MAG: hypothetical protein PSV24_01510 [Rhodoferax sp.]|nr:hypothetical protein [Rhodoferax sp.]